MPFAKVNGVSIHYETYGSGPGLILIPGWGGSGDSWRKNMIGMLATRCTVVTFDPRGTGRSDKPEEGYTSTNFADDAAALLKHLKLEPANVLGFSMGGSVAQVLALTHPESVRSLILVNTSASGGPRFPMNPVNSARFASIADPPPGSPPDYGARVVVELLYPKEYVDAHRDELVKEEYYSEYPTPKPVLQKMRGSGAAFTTYDKLPSLKVPTLILNGDADAMSNPENSRVLASRIPGAKLVVFHGAGHGLLKQMTGDAVKAILGFLP